MQIRMTCHPNEIELSCMALMLYHELWKYAGTRIFWATQGETHMRNVAKTSRSFIGETFSIFGAAVAVSAAVRAHRKPAIADLDTLGIDRKLFDKVQL